MRCGHHPEAIGDPRPPLLRVAAPPVRRAQRRAAEVLLVGAAVRAPGARAPYLNSAWQESGEVFEAFPLPGFCRLLCLSVFPAREFSERFAAAACSGWPQRPPSPGFRWWDHLGVFSVVVVTPEVPVGEGGSPNFQGEGGNGGCGKLCTVPCLSLPAEPTAEEICRVQGSCPSTQLPPLPTASRGLEESGSFTEEGAKPRGDGFHSFHRSSKGSRRIMSPSEL